MKPLTNFLLSACMIAVASSCKKENNLGKSIVGKWAINKLTINVTTLSTGSAADTTYQQESFTTTDFFQFNADQTAFSSLSAQFGITGKTASGGGGGNPSAGINNFTYSISGRTLTLINTSPILAIYLTPGPITEEIIKLDGQSLVLHRSETNASDKISTDTYYIRVN